jgi:hypothetical protein
MWRQGFTRSLTVEALAQHDGDTPQAYAGVIGRVREVWVLSGGLLGGQDALGYRFGAEGFFGRFGLLAQSRLLPGEIGSVDSRADLSDHFIEVDHQTRPALRLGLVARDREDGIVNVSFLRPTVSWRPRPGMWLDTRPDYDGRYVVNASWRVTPATTLRYFRSHTSSLEGTHEIGPRWETGRVTAWGGLREPTRMGIIALRAGVVWTAESMGYTVSASAPLAGGVFARAEYQSLPIVTWEGEDPGRLVVNLVTDYSQ